MPLHLALGSIRDLFLLEVIGYHYRYDGLTPKKNGLQINQLTKDTKVTKDTNRQQRLLTLLIHPNLFLGLCRGLEDLTRVIFESSYATIHNLTVKKVKMIADIAVFFDFFWDFNLLTTFQMFVFYVQNQTPPKICPKNAFRVHPAARVSRTSWMVN